MALCPLPSRTDSQRPALLIRKKKKEPSHHHGLMALADLFLSKRAPGAFVLDRNQVRHQKSPTLHFIHKDSQEPSLLEADKVFFSVS